MRCTPFKMTNSEIKDKILIELIKSDNYLTPIQIISKLELNKNKFEVLDLFTQIKSHPSNVASGNDSEGSETICKNAFTEDFIKSGGFVEFDKKIQRQNEKDIYDFQVSKWLAKTKWWPLVISFGALAVYLWSLFSES